MGKSSLLQRKIARPQQKDYACVYLDVTPLSGEDTAPLQWSKGIITVLWHELHLTEQINLRQWWEEQSGFSPLQRLHHFLEYALLLVPHKVYSQIIQPWKTQDEPEHLRTVTLSRRQALQ